MTINHLKTFLEINSNRTILKLFTFEKHPPTYPKQVKMPSHCSPLILSPYLDPMGMGPALQLKGFDQLQLICSSESELM